MKGSTGEIGRQRRWHVIHANFRIKTTTTAAKNEMHLLAAFNGVACWSNTHSWYSVQRAHRASKLRNHLVFAFRLSGWSVLSTVCGVRYVYENDFFYHRRAYATQFTWHISFVHKNDHLLSPLASNGLSSFLIDHHPDSCADCLKYNTVRCSIERLYGDMTF